MIQNSALGLFLSCSLILLLTSCARDAAAREILIECNDSSENRLETDVGFYIPYPREFEDATDGTERIVRSEVVPQFGGGNYSIPMVDMWVRQVTEADLEVWQLVQSDHPNAALVKAHRTEYLLENGKPFFYLAIHQNGHGIVLSSMVPVNLDSVLECLVFS